MEEKITKQNIEEESRVSERDEHMICDDNRGRDEELVWEDKEFEKFRVYIKTKSWNIYRD